MRYCILRGRLAGADWPMPDAAFVVDHGADPVRVPCSNLRCAGCGATVRHRDGLACRSDARGRAAELFAAPDWSLLDWLEADRPARLYACRCTLFRESLHRSIDEERDALDGGVPDWSCVGHPDAALPLSLDGVEVASVEAVGPLVERVLGGWAPPSNVAAVRAMPSLWLRRVAAQTEGTGVGEAIGAALGARLDDPGLRGAALHFFQHFPRDSGAERVVRAIAEHPDGAFDRSPVAGEGGWLSASVADVMVERLAGGVLDALDAVALDGLRAALMGASGPLPEGLVRWFAVHDGEQLARSAAGVERAHPEVWKGLLRALEESGRDELVLAAGLALLGADAVPAAELRTWAAAGHRQATGFALPLRLATQGR